MGKNGWQVKSLHELIESLESGGRPKGGGLLNGDIPSLGAEHLNGQGSFNFLSIKYIPFDYFNYLKKGVIENNDILIVKDGATTGKVSIVRNDFPFKNAAINEHLFLVRTNQRILVPLFAFYFLYSSIGNSQILSDFRGSAQGGISREFIKKVSIPLPPLEIQKQIAEILEKADKAKRKRKEANKLTDEFLQSVFVEMFGDPVKNPKGWETKQIIEISKVGTGGTPSREKPEYFTGDIPWVKTTEVTNDRIYDTEEKITNKALSDSNCVIFPTGTIVIALYGQGLTRGRTSILEIEACTNQACGTILPSKNINSIFLWKQLLHFYSYLRSLSRGGNQPNLNLSFIKNLKIIFPPQSLQEQFAEIVNKTEALKDKQKHSEIELENLFQSLMQKAFKGELV